jgi:hypothetical protein
MSADDFEDRLGRVEALVARLEALPDASARELSRELLATTLELHARGLDRVLELARESPSVARALVGDPRVSALLLLHGLHPSPLRERVEEALDAHELRGARVELVSVEGARVSVRLHGGAGFEPVVRQVL